MLKFNPAPKAIPNGQVLIMSFVVYFVADNLRKIISLSED
jgi:hypothetical protein